MKFLFCRPNIRAPLPWCVKEHGVLKFLLPKIAHFLTDFHSSWFPSLNLPPSDGKHKQLLNCHLEALYRRLEPLPGGRGEIGVHSSLYVGHKAFLGNQIVHCSPFSKFHTTPRQVWGITMHITMLVCESQSMTRMLAGLCLCYPASPILDRPAQTVWFQSWFCMVRKSRPAFQDTCQNRLWGPDGVLTGSAFHTFWLRPSFPASDLVVKHIPFANQIGLSPCHAESCPLHRPHDPHS